jgi:NADPH:quinone reductase-like Zn-dependent oxidoreductase
MKAILFDKFGDPREVLKVGEAPLPQPRPGEVRVKMKLVPINPSDLMVVSGQYGRLPSLPATPGFEGVGVIDAVGPGWLAKIRGLRPGRRVAVPNTRGGTWQEYVVLPAKQALPVPDDLPDEQIASFFVNPATVIVMIEHILRVRRGDWLVQTAAGSALGRMVIRLGKHLGFHTINLVRRRALVEDLKQIGADEVVVSGEDNLLTRVQQATGGSLVPFALDPVGGPGVVEVVGTLGPHGRLLVYGTLSGEPIPLDPRALMVAQRSIEGFWLSEWTKQQGILTMIGLIRRIVALMRAGVLTTPIAAVHTLDELGTAVELAQRAGRDGKVLLKLSSP